MAWTYPFNPHAINMPLNDPAMATAKSMKYVKAPPRLIIILGPCLSIRNPLMNCPTAYPAVSRVAMSPIVVLFSWNSACMKGIVAL